jgi:hypothetical protein
MDTAKIDTLMGKAAEAFDAGFTGKAAKQRAVDLLSRAYDDAAIMMHRPFLRMDHTKRTEKQEALYYGLPLGLANYRPQKHGEAYAAEWPELEPIVAKLEELVELREVIKAAEIIPPQQWKPDPRETRVRETFADLIARRTEQVEHAMSLAEIFHGLPVTAYARYCRNEHGTRWLRVDYYLAGVRTALQVILAAADRLDQQENAA